MRAPIHFPRISHLFALAIFMWILGSSPCMADDTVYPSVKVGTNTLTNVSVVLASPVDLLLKHDGGHLRVNLIDLTGPLAKKYPYDEKKAKAFAEANSAAKRMEGITLRERQLRAAISQYATLEASARDKKRQLRGKNGNPDPGKMKNFEHEIKEYQKKQEDLTVELRQVMAMHNSLQSEMSAPANPSSEKKKKK